MAPCFWCVHNNINSLPYHSDLLGLHASIGLSSARTDFSGVLNAGAICKEESSGVWFSVM